MKKPQSCIQDGRRPKRQTVYPCLSDELLTNPGIGFIAAPGLMNDDGPIRDTRGGEAERYKFTPDSRTWNHPDSQVFYCGARWRELEPVRGEYRWEVLEQKLDKARELGCTAVVRCSPYALALEDDIPAWFRAEYPDEPDFPFWRVDPNTTPYAQYWSEFVRAFGRRFDGHPLISSVDMALVGAWGEGGGTEFVDPDRVRTLAAAYLDSFKLTPLQMLLHDPVSTAIIKERKVSVGFRVDCLGDMGGFHGAHWSHMLDFYPQNIRNFGMDEAWKQAPVVFEACWHMHDWYLQGWDINYIIDESLKWHISSYNGKATVVPEAWKAPVERWLRKMGYRFELRRAAFDAELRASEPLHLSLLWVNSGVAPCYHRYPVTVRLRGESGEWKLLCREDIREWLPDLDVLMEERLDLPPDLTPGEYELAIGIETGIPEIGTLKLAIEGRDDGFYPMGKITIMAEEQ